MIFIDDIDVRILEALEKEHGIKTYEGVAIKLNANYGTIKKHIDKLASVGLLKKIKIKGRGGHGCFLFRCEKGWRNKIELIK